MKSKKRPETQDMVVMYTERHLTLRQIGALVGMTAAGVSKRLKAAGVSASDGEWVTEPCDYCGTVTKIARCRWRKTAKHFCSTQCYYKSRENPDYYQWRHGQNIARQIVARLFPLMPQHVVHHIDGNTANNSISNLLVFASQGDHMRHHHGVNQVEPIWKG